MRTTCRVPLQLLALRLSILYQRTCVGLGYGRIKINKIMNLYLYPNINYTYNFNYSFTPSASSKRVGRKIRDLFS